MDGIDKNGYDWGKNSQMLIWHRHGCYFLKAPYDLGNLVAKHVQRILKAGYARELAEEDFFHGHMCTESKFNGRIAYEDVFSKIKLMLYHTREDLDDWQPNSENNIPRSIIGRLDSSITIPLPIPNTDFQVFYEKKGTIFADWHDGLGYPWPFLLDGKRVRFYHLQGELVIGREVFDFVDMMEFRLEEKGRFLIENGTSLEVYMGVSHINDRGYDYERDEY